MRVHPLGAHIERGSAFAGSRTSRDPYRNVGHWPRSINGGVLREIFLWRPVPASASRLKSIALYSMTRIAFVLLLCLPIISGTPKFGKNNAQGDGRAWSLRVLPRQILMNGFTHSPFSGSLHPINIHIYCSMHKKRQSSPFTRSVKKNIRNLLQRLGKNLRVYCL